MDKNSELRALIDELSHEGGNRYREALELAIYDDLTRLFNRRYFMMRLKEEVQRGERFSTLFTLLLMDIDDFKDVNDRYGHPTGDTVLQELAQLLLDEFRTVDVVSRYGGEEFAVLLTESNLITALQAAERVLTAVRSHTFTALKIPITLSIGLAVFPQHGSHPDILLVQADNALYQAKIEGKDRVCISSTEIAREHKYKTRKMAPQNDRVILHDLSVTNISGILTVTVEFVFFGVTYIGKTSGGKDQLLTLAAEAAIRAIVPLLPKNVTISLEDIREITIGEERILTAFVAANDCTESLMLVGAVFVGHDQASSAVKVVLDALNRYIARKVKRDYL